MNYKKWVCIFTFTLFSILGFVATTVAYIDPFFHYHKPRPEFFYPISMQRYQNNGITKHFDYDAIITGTSMTENFKTTEFDKLYDVKSIKVSYSGGSYKEMNDNLKVAFDSGHKIRAIVRELDYTKIIDFTHALRTDLGKYPTYLYNDNIWDDTKYLCSWDAFYKYSCPIIWGKIKDKKGGYTDFDTYSNWNKSYKFGKEPVLRKEKKFTPNSEQKDISAKDIQMAQENIKHNVINLAKEHPETTFYYFFPPYSVVYWAEQMRVGNFERILAAEKLAIEMILECDNIKLYSFNLMTDITANLNNYKDSTHYGEWINSDILKYMKEEKGLITKENYKDYLLQVREIYSNYPYAGIWE